MGLYAGGMDMRKKDKNVDRKERCGPCFAVCKTDTMHMVANKARVW
jgi:hypothetical protein